MIMDPTNYGATLVLSFLLQVECLQNAGVVHSPGEGHSTGEVAGLPLRHQYLTFHRYRLSIVSTPKGLCHCIAFSSMETATDSCTMAPSIIPMTPTMLGCGPTPSASSC